MTPDATVTQNGRDFERDSQLVSDTPLQSSEINNNPRDPSIPLKYADKLNTNYLPTSDEAVELKGFVSGINNEVNQLTEEIKTLELSLRDLQNKRMRLKEAAAPYQALSSPLRTFPPELLQCIFAWCLPQNRNAVMHSAEAPVLLGRVCSTWRRISLATPEIWSRVHIVPPNVNLMNLASSMERFRRKRELVETWLSRSGVCPLDVSFVWFGGDSDDEIGLCGTLLEALVPLSKQWRQLDFQVPLKMFKPFEKLGVGDVPLLEGMSLLDNRSTFETEVVEDWPVSLMFAGSATRLQKFTLTFFSGGMRLPSIPWSQLTVLYLESNIAFFFTDSFHMLSTLQLCTSLESCTLKFPLSHTASLPRYRKVDIAVNLPHLNMLCLDGDQNLPNTFHMSNTLDNLCLPKLEHLEIQGRSGSPEDSTVPEPLTSIRKLLERSKCSLDKIKLESLDLAESEFMACLRLAPELTELAVHNWGLRLGPVPMEESSPAVVENQILRALTVNATSDLHPDIDEDKKEHPMEMPHEVLCPNLATFDFTLCGASQELLCQFVESRWNLGAARFPVRQLKSVKANFTAREDLNVGARLKAMRDRGLELVVAFHNPLTDEPNPSPWTGVEGM